MKVAIMYRFISKDNPVKQSTATKLLFLRKWSFISMGQIYTNIFSFYDFYRVEIQTTDFTKFVLCS